MTARLEISLGALIANYRTFRAHSGGEVGAVVKANAYGLGMRPVAQALSEDGCRSFFVATRTEGKRLRQSLDAPATIYVLEGCAADPEAFRADQLIPVLNSLAQIVTWDGAGPAAVMIDTGMNRLGLALAEVEPACAMLHASPTLVLTHFAAADDAESDVTRRQIEAFDEARSHLEGRFGTLPVSVANSPAALSGVLSDSGLANGLVRAGVGLYGGNPFLHAANPFQPVVFLTGQIAQIRHVPAGAPVGYGGGFVPEQESVIAVVDLGYADGLPRLLSNRGTGVVGGARVPIVGRISMDMVHLDVTGLDGLSVGDPVEFLGSNIGVDEVAHHAQTIGYEVLTGLNAAGRLTVVYSGS